MTHQLASLLAKNEFTAVGLMSGTSMDGVDAALVTLDSDADRPAVELREFVSVAYPGELRTSLTEMASGEPVSVSEVATLATAVAVAFAGAFYEVCRMSGIDPSSVDFIGSHGQTVAHVPPSPGTVIAGTLQLGSPGAIAALTGVTVVGDFRTGDLALGGHGAPLAPAADYLLRRSEKKSRVILNIGGIANVTFLPAGGGREDVVAFDTGPGNMVLDALYRVLYGGDEGFDRGGRAALEGSADADIVSALMQHPYFALSPPRSAGHQEFGPQFAWKLQTMVEEKGLGRADSLATAAALTADTIADALDRFIMSSNNVDEIFITGGGLHNEAIMSRLRGRLGGIDIRAIDELGIPADAKEAVDFSLLARETIFARPNVLPGVTGASRDQVLGAIASGGRS